MRQEVVELSAFRKLWYQCGDTLRPFPPVAEAPGDSRPVDSGAMAVVNMQSM